MKGLRGVGLEQASAAAFAVLLIKVDFTESLLNRCQHFSLSAAGIMMENSMRMVSGTTTSHM